MKEIIIPLYEIHEIFRIPGPGARISAVETLGSCFTELAKDFKDKKIGLHDFDRRLRDLLKTTFNERGLSYDPEDLIKDCFTGDNVRILNSRTP